MILPYSLKHCHILLTTKRVRPSSGVHLFITPKPGQFRPRPCFENCINNFFLNLNKLNIFSLLPLPTRRYIQDQTLCSVHILPDGLATCYLLFNREYLFLFLPISGSNTNCNSTCWCPSEQFDPVCGADGQAYFSACHAGCSLQHYDKARQRIHF